uniref:Uncharacterized protein n=1 Tax=Rhizophora mucronata TaxID=61149 RepID=A0A2P2NE66_RHIMU
MHAYMIKSCLHRSKIQRISHPEEAKIQMLFPKYKNELYYGFFRDQRNPFIS